MMKRILLLKVSFFIALCIQAKPVKLFCHYQNDTLLANDIRLQEKPINTLTANDVLNKWIVYKNAYSTVTNNVFDASKVGSVPVNDFYPRLFTSSNELRSIQSLIQTTNIGKHQRKEATNYISKTISI